MRTLPRILVVAHGHPDFSKGGAEVAAYGHYRAYANNANISEAFFLARQYEAMQDQNIIVHKNNEYLWINPDFDQFWMCAKDSTEAIMHFVQFLEMIDPDIVHIEHTYLLGYELIESIKQYDPQIKIIYTLHEYLPICHNDGQMLKPGGKLCTNSDPLSCHNCFPDIRPLQFAIRKRKLQHYFSFVDKFVTPSNFLQDRYIAWGLEANRLYTIDNGLQNNITNISLVNWNNDKLCHIGFFGQLSYFKGLAFFMEVIALLPIETRKKVRIDIHGDKFGYQPDWFQASITKYRQAYEREGILHWGGAYGQHELADRLARVDWVIIPSLWWENSPIVIQEAFAAGRPVIAANMGGMAEKVRDGVDGLLYSPGQKQALVSILDRIINDPALWHTLHRNIRKPMQVAASAEAYLRLIGYGKPWEEDNL